MVDSPDTCPFCQSPISVKYPDFFGRRLLSCIHCRIFFQSSFEDLSSLYTEAYFDDLDTEDDCNKKENFRRFLTLIEDHRPPLSAPQLLDVGAARGYFVEEALKSGFHATGIEFSPSVIHRIPSSLRNRILEGDFLDFDFGNLRYSVISCISVFEHVPDPGAFLQKMHELLVPGGIVLIMTPDIQSLSCRLMGRRWPHYNRQHLFYFSRFFFSRRLESHGFALSFFDRPKNRYLFRYILTQMAQNSSGIPRAVARGLKSLLPRWAMRSSVRLGGGNLLVVLKKK